MNEIEEPGCDECGEMDFFPNIEAYEMNGKILCDECASYFFDEISECEE